MATRQNRIFTDDNCTGCNRCIEACTVPEANVATLDNGKNKIHIDDDHCIRCGMCIDVCPNDARNYADDTEAFIKALKNGEQVSVLVAPAIKSNYPDYKRFLGLLKSLGVNSVYDVSFGADICTWAYIRYLQDTKNEGMISQPCPVVVNYIEKHDPSLIDKLIPIQSPAMCAATYMKKYADIRDKLAFISPCIAKSDEFQDPNTGQTIDYNVTFWMLREYFNSTGINYLDNTPAEYDNEDHGLGSLYPMPGGLKQNVISYIPNSWVYQIEGQPYVRNFLDDYQLNFSSRKTLPLLVDVLNCKSGCNLGTGSIAYDEDALDVDRAMYEEINLLELNNNKNKTRKTLNEFDKRLNKEDFKRKYTKKHVKPRMITEIELENAFKALKKETPEERTTNCCSCGFPTCEGMAIAIAREINHVENCVDYNKSILKEKSSELKTVMNIQQQKSLELKHTVEEVFSSISANTELTNKTTDEVASISSEIENITKLAHKLHEVISTVNSELQDYKKMGTNIVDISTMSKLLSLNASIEAVNAGIYGKGFGVVAEEMHKLSEQTANNAKTIIEQNENIFPLLDEVTSMNDNLNSQIKVISNSADDILKAVEAISQAENMINNTVKQLID